MFEFPQIIGNSFLLGSHLCRQPMPKMSELKADMEILKSHGFNCIKLQEHWQTDEQQESRYDFSCYEELIEHAAKLELGVYIGLTMEQAPHWLYRKYPDCRLVTYNGLPVQFEAVLTLPSDGKPGPCFDHPGVRFEQEKFIENLVRKLGRYENILVWNVWQEISTNIWSSGMSDGLVCFCEHTLAFFRSWLIEEYGSLDVLNKAWNTRYADIEDVCPERRSSQGPYAVNIAWQYFFDNIHIARILDDRCQAIKAADALKRPVFAHRGAPDIASPRDWNFSRKLDFMSSSCYPSRGSANPWDDEPGSITDDSIPVLTREMQGMADEIMLRFDHIRSCNPTGAPLWAAEFQGGPKNIGLQMGNIPTPDDIRGWMLTGAAYGLTGIHFWVTRAEIMAHECNGFSLLDSEGATSCRLEEAARIGKFLKKHADIFAVQSSPQPEIGILLDEWNYKLCELLNVGGFAPRKHLQYSVRGWYRMLWERNYHVDFVDISGVPAEWLAKYKVLIYPFPVSLSEKAAGKIVEYVHGGGNIISEAMCGKIDENGFCNRGELSPIMRDLFGVSHLKTFMVSEPDDGHRWTPQTQGWAQYYPSSEFSGTGVLNGCTLRANLFIEEFAAKNAAPCMLLNGKTVGTFRKIRDGGAWLLGTIAGHNGTAYCDAASRQCISEILKVCGVNPKSHGKLILKNRHAENKEIRFLINPFPVAITETMAVVGWSSAGDIDENSLNICDGTLNVSVAPGDIEAIVLVR